MSVRLSMSFGPIRPERIVTETLKSLKIFTVARVTDSRIFALKGQRLKSHGCTEFSNRRRIVSLQFIGRLQAQWVAVGAANTTAQCRAYVTNSGGSAQQVLQPATYM